MRMTGVVCFLFVVGCAESQPAQRKQMSRADDAANEQALEDRETAEDPERHDAIQRVFARKATELQQCWAEEYDRTKNRKLEGNLTVQVVVGPSGKANEARVLESSLNSPGIDKCVEKAVLGWSFPEGKGNMHYHRTVHLGAQF